MGRCIECSLHEGETLPITFACRTNSFKILLLLWKALLLIFGTTKELEKSKEALQPESGPNKKKEETILTASPLDYHVFRQEITSKYPAYNPPPPLVPLEINNNSILPPLPNHPSRTTSHDSLQGLGTTINGASKSIFHQPVHISTPAPSPPPSPAGPGGKGGKKQNYQTNQNFPFLYPPLDSTSNDLGGKGGAGLQDKLVGKKWKGSDIPASILEAAQLFASRMRMSRALRQLWEVREEFIKFERGWEDDKKKNSDDDNDGAKGSDDEKDLEEDLEYLDLDDSSDSEIEDSEEASEPSKKAEEAPFEPKKETDNEFVQERLDAVEGFYVSVNPAYSRLHAYMSIAQLSSTPAIHCHCTPEDPTLECHCAGKSVWTEWCQECYESP